MQEELGKNHPRTLKGMIFLAKIYQKQNFYDQAQDLYQQALSLQQESLGTNHPDTLETLNSLSSLYLAQGNYKEVLPLLSQSLRQTNSFLEHILWGTSKLARQSYLNQQEKVSNRLLSFYSLTQKPELAQEVLYYSLTRKGLLLRVSSEINSLVQIQGTPELKKTATELDGLKQSFAQLSLHGPARGQKPENFQVRLKELDEKISQLEAQVGREVERFRRARTEVLPAQIVEALQKKQILLDFLSFR